MFCCTMDLVAWYHLRAFENSSFAPFARSIVSVVHEERFHASFGRNRVKTLMTSPDYRGLCGATTRDVQTALLRWYPRALDTFGRNESRFSDPAVRYGIRRYGNEQLRQQWMADINPFFQEVGLEVPDPSYDRHVL